MIGDVRGLSRAFAICKAIAAYNMVYVHGVTIIAREIPTMNFATWKFMDISVFRGIASVCLPLFAGFFIRHEVAPYIVNHRLPFRFFKQGLDFFMLALAIETLRLVLLTLSPAYIFNWHALHFISLSMLFTYGILFVDQRLLYPVVVLIFLFRPLLQIEILDPLINHPEPSTEVLHWGAVFWASFVVGLLYWGFSKIRSKKQLPWRSLHKNLFLFIGLLLTVLLWALSYSYILNHLRGLTSFVNLPYAIFLPSLKDDNYWSFFVCFPIFITGYFLKEFLFNIKFKKYLWILNLSAAFMAMYFLFFRFREFESKLPVKSPFSKEIFAIDHLTIMSFISFSYLGFLACYYYCRSRKTPWLDRFTYYSRSVLMIYIVHGTIFMIFRKSFPFSLNQEWSPFQNLVFVIVSIHICYFISLFIAHRMTTLLERWKLNSTV